MPQVPELNRGVWGDLEDYCRELVQQGKELYIVAGPVGRKGSIGKVFDYLVELLSTDACRRSIAQCRHFIS
ncbi:DNA/RNA non-specific endonuclease [Microcoleus sp. B4-D4]